MASRVERVQSYPPENLVQLQNKIDPYITPSVRPSSQPPPDQNRPPSPAACRYATMLLTCHHLLQRIQSSHWLKKAASFQSENIQTCFDLELLNDCKVLFPVGVESGSTISEENISHFSRQELPYLILTLHHHLLWSKGESCPEVKRPPSCTLT